MKVLLRNPRRYIETGRAVTLNRLLDDLDLNREAHLVIRNGTMVPGDAGLEERGSVERVLGKRGRKAFL